MPNFRLKELRIEKSISQNELAKLIGLARQTYNHYEVQENIIPLKHLNTLSNYYNVSCDYILGLTNTKKYKNNQKEIDSQKCGTRLKELRKNNHITQIKIANFLHIDQPTWSIYEHGKSLIGTPFLYMVCQQYNISADYLLGKIDYIPNFKEKNNSSKKD